jgi:PAS domain S-box-containing protein
VNIKKLLDMSDFNLESKLYWWGLVIIGSAISLISLGSFQSFTPGEWTKFGFLVGLVVIASRHPLRIPNTQASVSVSDVFIFLGLFFLGIGPAVWLSALDNFVAARLTSKRKLNWILSFHTGAIAILQAALVFAWVLKLSLGQAPSWPISQSQIPFSVLLPAVIVLALMQYLGSGWLVAFYFARRQRKSPYDFWRSGYLWTSWTFFAAAIAATLIYFVIKQYGFIWVIATVPIIGASFLTYKIYFERINEKTRHLEQVNQLHQTTVDTLAMAVDAKERLQDILDNANDLIQSITPEGRFLYVNRAWQERLSHSDAEIATLSMLDIVAPQDKAEYANTLERLRLGEKVDRIEVNLLTSNGVQITVEGSMNCSAKEGEPLAIRSIFRDITERKQAEEALHSSEEQLRQSQKMDAVGRLAGGVAHDFNNLLTAITGYSDLVLRRMSKDDPMREDIEEIRKAGDRAAALTRQLLAFSRKQVLQPKVVDLNTIVLEMNKMLRRLIGEHIELVTIPAPALGHVKADPGQLEQVLMNLVINSRDAMAQGGKLIIETANCEVTEEKFAGHEIIAPGAYVTLTVTDTGCGMAAETQSKIFEPFFTTKGQGKGTGLGLSTVYGIINQSCGQISLQSQVGEGTTFTIFLPRVEEVAEALPVWNRLTTVAGNRETILLVEDEEVVRRFTRETLKMNGYNVLEAGNGHEALTVSAAHAGAIHLLLTDVVMPGMGGRELVDRLVPLRPEMKVLYMSGYTDDAIIHHGVLEGAAFLQKPFTLTELTQKVREGLGSKTSDSQPDQPAYQGVERREHPQPIKQSAYSGFQWTN